ncbi:hypothetical protein GCM10009037_30610 [Halarchaeum grantii]|uniref:Uncharacterized protein n=1 Tax=Halarchaeum grantii TaxID=1193105 RepID=A0A830FDS8_9EURY|nr:hypothetical protein GCM10009037_30610 [Halarchaeum grantii]
MSDGVDVCEKRPVEPTVTDAGVLDVVRRHLELLHEVGTVKRRQTGETVFWCRAAKSRVLSQSI